ncbi:hypothetical protein EON65_54020 [archaeon]|nr:MAG: hypothetical protein EON65_54020 [archaeon]
MIETAVGVVTIIGWVFGLWCYPRCVDYVSDCCDKTQTPNSNVAIDEAFAEYTRQDLDDQPSLPAKYYRWGNGDSPLFDRAERLPVAKLLKVD